MDAMVAAVLKRVGVTPVGCVSIFVGGVAGFYKSRH